MDYFTEMLEHLMRFVRIGSEPYALAVVKKYEKNDPWRLTGLAAALDVEIARLKQAMRDSKPSSQP